MRPTTPIRLGSGRLLGDGAPCFLIAEIGANHNGSLALAKELIDAAADAGADAAKFQIYRAESLYSKHTPRHSGYKKPLYELIKEIETPRAWITELAAYARERGVLFLATPFDEDAVHELDGVSELFKVASFELVDLDLLRVVARTGKPAILSTGLATLEEIQDALDVFRAEGNPQVILLQCASKYPSPASIMNLRSMETMRAAFGAPTGLSDHTPGFHVALAAVALGACVVEKHVTMDRTLEGPDHPFAIEPDELKAFVSQAREIESAMGEGLKTGPSEEEREFYTLARRSLHAACDIPAGCVIEPSMLCAKRPGLGIRPKYAPLVAGRAARRDIEADHWITWDMI
jgi:N-acetylneuraminate synthase/N,N'-diacetyllegionaminate synthase